MFKLIIQSLATIMGIVMSLGYYPQAYRIWKNRSAQDISLSSFSIFVAGTTTWFAYGVYLGDAIIMASFILGVIGSWLVLLLTIRYRKPRVDAEKTDV